MLGVNIFHLNKRDCVGYYILYDPYQEQWYTSYDPVKIHGTSWKSILYNIMRKMTFWRVKGFSYMVIIIFFQRYQI